MRKGLLFEQYRFIQKRYIRFNSLFVVLVYIISTGVTHSIRDLLTVAFEHVGIKEWEKYITLDPRFKRPAELHTLQGKSDKAKQKLGWQPKVGFEELVKMMVLADLKRLEKN